MAEGTAGRRSDEVSARTRFELNTRPGAVHFAPGLVYSDIRMQLIVMPIIRFMRRASLFALFAAVNENAG